MILSDVITLSALLEPRPSNMQSTSGLTGYSACRTGLGHNEGVSVAHLRARAMLSRWPCMSNTCTAAVVFNICHCSCCRCYYHYAVAVNVLLM